MKKTDDGGRRLCGSARKHDAHGTEYVYHTHAGHYFDASTYAHGVLVHARGHVRGLYVHDGHVSDLHNFGDDDDDDHGSSMLLGDDL